MRGLAWRGFQIKSPLFRFRLSLGRLCPFSVSCLSLWLFSVCFHRMGFPAKLSNRFFHPWLLKDTFSIHLPTLLYGICLAFGFVFGLVDGCAGSARFSTWLFEAGPVA